MCDIVTHPSSHRQGRLGFERHSSRRRGRCPGEVIVPWDGQTPGSRRDRSRRRPKPQFSSSQSLQHSAAQREALYRGAACFRSKTLCVLEFQATDVGAERPPPCRGKIAVDGTANFTYTYEVR
jgi:hypothetical protein